jgi:hypothetical protein
MEDGRPRASLHRPGTGRAGRSSSNETVQTAQSTPFLGLHPFWDEPAKNYKKGVGMTHKMIYLGRHKI